MLIGIWGTLIKSVKQRFALYFASVNEQAPFLGYLGIAFWSAWILSTSGVQDWISSSSGAASTFSAAYTETRVVLIAALIICGAFGSRLSHLFDQGKAILAIAAMAVLGDICLATSWLIPESSPVLLHVGSLLAGLGAAMLLIKAGILYSALSPWRAMLLFMTSQLIAACLYLVITVAPTPISTALFCLLPLFGAITFALIPAKGHPEARPKTAKSFGRSFARLVFMIFAFRFCSNYIKTLLATFQTSEAIELGVVGNILLKMLVAFIFICYAFNASKKVDYGRVCYFLFVGTTIILVVLPLFEDQIPLFYALNGTLSGITGNVAFCIFAYICFQSKASSLRIFGFGYSAVLLGSLIGYLIGGNVGPLLTEGNLSSTPFLVAAYALILLALLISPPKQLDQLMLPVSYEDVIDIAKKKSQATGEIDRMQARCQSVAQRYGLTERERDVLVLLARGHGRKYVADHLQVSLNTVRSHSRNIYGKLGIHSHSELMALLESAEDDRIDGRPA